MKTLAFRISSALTIAALALPIARLAQADDAAKSTDAPLQENIRHMIEAARDGVFPALVNISVVTMRYWDGKEHKGRATGSGTIISPDGYVVTNQHVTFNGKTFKCTLADKQEISAKLIGEDPLTDLAVLKLNLSELKDPAMKLPVATWGNSDDLRVGDSVMAMGSPLALSRSVTLGIVSNTERVFAGGMGIDQDSMELEEGQRTGLFTRWIQHDALINPGNSGGPLVNMQGQIVGINELGGAAIGFAIPSNLARLVVNELIKHGEVPRSWVGVSFRPIQKTGYSHGVLVNSVVENGPAGKAGLEAGDLIVKVNGEALTVRFPEEVPPLMRTLAELPIASKVKIAYERAGKSGELEIVTEKLQKDRGDESAFRGWGLTALAITDYMAREWKLDSVDGILVSSIRRGGPAQLAEPALDEDDVIRSIDGKPVKDLAAFIDIYSDIMKRKPLPEYVAVGFERRGRNLVTLLKPTPDKDDDPPREVPKAWIGIATQPVLKELAKRLGHADQLGFRVTRVYPKTRAADAGLQVGDVILSVNGDKVTPRGIQDSGLLERKVRKMSIDDKATLKVLRGKETLDVKLPLERTRLAPDEARRELNRDFELTVRELTFFDRDENRWDDDVKGVLVQQAEPAGWAGLAGVRGGDLIQRVGDYPITDLESYRAAMKKITEAQPDRVVFVVLRGVETRFLFAEPDWKPAAESTTTQKTDSKD